MDAMTHHKPLLHTIVTVVATLVTLVRAAAAQTLADEAPSSQTPPPQLAMQSSYYPVPNHLVVGDQLIDLSVAGLRNYLETLKTTDSRLYPPMVSLTGEPASRSDF
jgi:hypothetical protein